MQPRVLSVDQPWAWAICDGIRPILSRLWDHETRFTGPVLIHAARTRFDLAGSQWLLDQGYDIPRNLPRGSIVGRVQLTACAPDGLARRTLSRDTHRWMVDDPAAFHLVLTEPEHAPFPMPCAGTRAQLGRAPQGWKAAFEVPAEAG